jgi:hypothetical protein
MNVLNVRYDVYGGVPDDLARSSITISRRFGTPPSYSALRGHYTVLWSSGGQFQIYDCALIRFFKMLNKLEIHPRRAGDGGRNVFASAWEKNFAFRPFRAVGAPQR